MTELKYMSVKELKEQADFHLDEVKYGNTHTKLNDIINELAGRIMAPYRHPPKAQIYKWEDVISHNKIHTAISDEEYNMAYALIMKYLELKNKDFDVKVTITIEQK